MAFSLSRFGFIWSRIDPFLAADLHRRFSSAIMASMMPFVGMFWIAVLPLKSEEMRSAHDEIGRFMRSGRMPSVSALKTLGTKLT